MVFFGIPLPAKNQAIRMANLNIALQNDAIKLLSAATIISQNIKDHPEVVQAKLENLVRTPLEKVNEIKTRNLDILKNTKTTPLLMELQAKLNAPKMGLKSPTKVNLTIDTEEKTPAISSGPSTPESEASTMSSLSGLSDIEQGYFNDMKNQFMSELNKISSAEMFDAFFNKWRSNALPFNDRLGKAVQIKIPYTNKTDPNKTIKYLQLEIGKTPARSNLDKSRELFLTDKKSFINNFSNELEKSYLSGEGLFKTKNSLSSKRSPNFGNLWLNEKLLKRNNLSIMRPYSNIYEISAKGISNLLKKMIIDIANTLEFDVKDYENLESDEKKIIERIIYKQKDMKNYNIQSLIGDDINKSRKRLEILFGEINSGNNSSLVFDEALELLKSLYKNGFLSHTKYNNLRRSIIDMR